MADIVSNAKGDKLQLVDGQWVPLQTDQGSVIGGQYSPRAGTLPRVLEDVGDYLRGINMGINNVAEFFGREPDPVREAAERQALSRSPIAAALGEGSVSAALAVPGAALGEAGAGIFGLRALGTALSSALGAGAAGQIALDDDDPGANILENAGLDVVSAMAIGGLGRVPSIANKVVQSIRQGGKFRRVVEPGDLADGGQALVNRIQDSGIPITRSQASGNAADRITENSLRRDPFQAGPQLQTIDNAQQVAVNRLAADAIGLPPGTDFIDATQLAGAKQNIGDGIEAIGNSVDDFLVDPTVIQQFDALADSPFIASTTGTKGLNKIANDLRKRFEAGTPISGQEWKDIRENVNGALGASDGPDAQVLGKALDIVDDMPPMEPELAQEYGKLREQWRTMLQLEKGATLTPEGNVNVGQLNRNLQNSFGNVVENPSRTFESQELREISEAFGARRMTKTPTSGTAENLQVAQQVQNMSEIAGQAAVDPVGAAARGVTLGATNAVLNPLWLAPPTDEPVEQLIRAFGNTLSSAAEQEVTGGN